MKRILSFFLLFFIPHVFAKNLIIGTIPNNPPFSYLVGSGPQLAGFDVEIIQELCLQMQSKCTIKSMPFNNLFTAVNDEKIDLAIAAIIITPSRSAGYEFSLPYLPSSGSFFAIKSSKITGIQEVVGKKIGIRSPSAYAQLLTSVLSINNKVTFFASVNDLLEAMSKKSVDVGLMDTKCAAYWTMNNGNNFKLVGHPLTIGYGYGIMSKKGNKELIDAVNKALLTTEANGTFLQIYTASLGS